jgi:hypothetical protein
MCAVSQFSSVLRIISLGLIAFLAIAAVEEPPVIAPNYSNETSDVFRNLVIPGGKAVALPSSLDFTTASAAAVTLVCTTCTSNATSLASASLVLQARWIIPNAEYAIPTETKSSNSFAFYEAGNASFAVFGPQFTLILQNKGSQGILIQQITFFRRGQ